MYNLFTEPFTVDINSLETAFQLEVIDLQSSFTLRTIHNESNDLKAFYKCLDKSNYPEIVENALKLVSVFGSSYICEQAFSIMNLNKSKLRSGLTDEHLHAIIRVANSGTNMEQLVSKKSCNISH